MASVYGGVGQGEILSRIRFAKATFPTREEVLAYLKGADYVIPEEKVADGDGEWVATIVEAEAWSTRTTEVTPGITVEAIQPKALWGYGPMCFAEFSTDPWDWKPADMDVDAMLKVVPKAMAKHARAMAKDEKRDVTKADLKLPIMEKSGKVNVNALKAARGALAGARGGVKLPADLKDEIQAELDKHWAAWEKAESKMAEENQAVETFAEASMCIMRAGNYRGKDWTVDRFDEAVKNFDAGTLGCPNPLVLGHSEDQEILEESGLPAVGLASKLWRKGEELWAKVRGIPEVVAKLMEDGIAYPSRSAEMYHDYVDDKGVHHGTTLRRISLLGDTIPQIKNLGGIVALKYSETALRPRGDAVWINLSETKEDAMGAAIKDEKKVETKDQAKDPAIDKLAEAKPESKPEAKPEVKTDPKPVTTPADAERFAEFDRKLGALSGLVTEKDKIIEDLRKQNSTHADRFAELDRRASRVEAESWVREQVGAGRLMPYEAKGGMVEFFMELSSTAGSRVVKFSEVTGKNDDGSPKIETREKSLLEKFREFVGGLGERIPLPGKDGDELAGEGSESAKTPTEAGKLLAKFAEEYALKEKIPLADARRAVVKQHPDLDALRRGRAR